MSTEEFESLINNAINQFNATVKNNEELQSDLENITKRVQFELSDGNFYHIILENKTLSSLKKGAIEKPDIRILTDKDTIIKILRKEMSPLKAWATRKVQIKGSFMDLLKFRKFF